MSLIDIIKANESGPVIDTSRLNNPVKVIGLTGNPYRYGIAQLGIWNILHYLYLNNNVVYDRAFGDDELLGKTIDGRVQSSEADIIFNSLAFETTVVNSLQWLIRAGIPILREERINSKMQYPYLIAGGPVTYNPVPILPFYDAIVIGDGIRASQAIVEFFRRYGSYREFFLDKIGIHPEIFVPELHDFVFDHEGYLRSFMLNQGLGRDKKAVPASSQHLSENPYYTLYSSKLAYGEKYSQDYLAIMAAMGCDRVCAFCFVGQNQGDDNGRAVTLSKDRLFEIIQEHGQTDGMKKLIKLFFSSGLKGNNDLKQILDELHRQGHQVEVGSLAIPQVDEELVYLLKKAGATKLTIAPEVDFERRFKIRKYPIKKWEIYNIVNLCNKYELDLTLYTLLGIPYEIGIERQHLGDLIVGCRCKLDDRLTLEGHLNNIFAKPNTANERAPQLSAFYARNAYLDTVNYVHRKLNLISRKGHRKIGQIEWISVAADNSSKGGLLSLEQSLIARGGSLVSNILADLAENDDLRTVEGIAQLCEKYELSEERIYSGFPDIRRKVPWDFVYSKNRKYNDSYIKTLREEADKRRVYGGKEEEVFYETLTYLYETLEKTGLSWMIGGLQSLNLNGMHELNTGFHIYIEPDELERAMGFLKEHHLFSSIEYYCRNDQFVRLRLKNEEFVHINGLNDTSDCLQRRCTVYYRGLNLPVAPMMGCL